jgi:hypothetical protein
MKHWPVRSQKVNQNVLRKYKPMMLMMLGCLLKLYCPKLNLKWYTVRRWREVDSMAICVQMAERRKAVITAE